MATLTDSVYSWWLHPVAVNDGDVTWVGGVSEEGINKVHRVSRDSVDVIELDGPHSGNDHNGTAIAYRPDRGDLIAFYPRHNTDSFLRWQRISRSTLEVGEQQQLEFGGGVAYAQVLIYGTFLHVIVRSGGSWLYRTSTNWGATWGPVKTLVDGSSFTMLYTVVRQDRNDPETVHLAVGSHPIHTGYRALSYATCSLATGEIVTPDGTSLGNLNAEAGPEIDPETLSIAVTLETDDRARLLDVGTQAGGPAIAFAIWDEGSNGDAVYRVVRWTGGSWSVADWSVPAGSPFWSPSTYLGGVAVGADSDLWVAREDDDWRVERYLRTETGGYALAETVAVDSTMLLRPYVPFPHGGLTQLLWQRMHAYEHFQTFTGDTVARIRPADVPDDGEDLPPVAEPAIRRDVTWLACDAVTGQIVTEIPGVTVDDVSRLLGAYTTTKATLPIPTVGPRNFTLTQRATLAKRATVPRRAMIVAIVNDLPAWAGLVVRRVSGTGPNLELSLVTLEGYFDRRQVRNLAFAQVDQSLIMRDLLRQAEDIDGVGQGLGFSYQVTLSGILRDRTYLATDRATIYRRVRELMGVQNGPEWTVDLDWTDADQTAIRKIVRIGPRIGAAAAEPHALFQTTAHGVFSAVGSSSATYTLTEDYSDGRGANWVEAYAPGEGDDQPSSEPHVDGVQLDAGAPIFERHWQPSSSIETVETLNGHAAAELERLRDGSRLFEIEARWDAYPRYGVDWRLGDDIAWELVGHAHPDGLVGQGRAIGWSLDMGAGLIRPKLLDPSGEVSV